MLGDIAYRAYSIHLLRQVAAQYEDHEHFPAASLREPLPVEGHSENGALDNHLTSEEEAEYEDDDSFPLGIQEKKYDSQKKEFCHGRQPLHSSSVNV